jgi:hypothetical protein
MMDGLIDSFGTDSISGKRVWLMHTDGLLSSLRTYPESKSIGAIQFILDRTWGSPGIRAVVQAHIFITEKKMIEGIGCRLRAVSTKSKSRLN